MLRQRVVFKLHLKWEVGYIGPRAFSDCTSLASVTIPDSITDIDECVFYNCPYENEVMSRFK